MNRFYIPEHCSTQLRVLGIDFQLRWIIEGTISKEVELWYIHLISRFTTSVFDPNLYNLDSNYVYANIFDRYSVWHPSLKHLSLYEFAAKVEVEYQHLSKLLIENVMLNKRNQAPKLPSGSCLWRQSADVIATIQTAHLHREVLGDNKHTVIKERLKAALISTPNFNPEEEAENSYYNFLFLFLQARNEDTSFPWGDPWNWVSSST